MRLTAPLTRSEKSPPHHKWGGPVSQYVWRVYLPSMAPSLDRAHGREEVYPPSVGHRAQSPKWPPKNQTDFLSYWLSTKTIHFPYLFFKIWPPIPRWSPESRWTIKAKSPSEQSEPGARSTTKKKKTRRGRQSIFSVWIFEIQKTKEIDFSDWFFYHVDYQQKRFIFFTFFQDVAPDASLNFRLHWHN